MIVRIICLSMAAVLLASCASEPTVTSAPQDNGPVGGVIAAKSGLSGGSASYRIHVVVPPGRNQVEPSFDIRYSSQDGNGLMGMGWDFTTPESIFRCPATLAMDGYSAGVRYAKSDRLCLDGNHLVLTSGVYGHSGSTYLQEINNDSLTTLVGHITSTASYFVVTYQDGDKGYFKGAYVPDGSTEPLYWYMSRYEDKEGSTTDYSYDKSLPGEMLLSEIRYSGHDIDGAETPGTRFVRFSYEARPDVSSVFLAGGESRQTRRLAGIVVGMDAAQAGTLARETREFGFTYIESAATGRSLLSEVHECLFGTDGKKQCLPKTRFSWEDEPPAFKAPTAYSVPTQDSNLQPLQLLDATSIMRSPYIAAGDFDGDGRRELLYYRPGVGAHLYFLKADGTLRQDVDVSKFFQSPPEMMFHSGSYDVDNDGAADLPGNVGGHLAFLSWTGAGMGAPVVTDIPYSEKMALGYVTGSRQPDVIQIEPVSAGSSDLGLYLYRNLGSQPGALHFAKRQLIYALKGSKAGGAGRQGFVEVGDIDGNGLPDTLILSNGHVDAVILSRQDEQGAQHFDVTTAAAIGMTDRPLDGDTHLADINGDGLFDIVYSDGPDGGPRTWRYQLNRGGHFDPPVDTQVPDERPAGAGITSSFVADIDNDGKEELLYPDKIVVPYCLGAGLNVWRSKTIDRSHCADDAGGMDNGFDDLSIYQFAVLKFHETADGHLAPVVIHDSGIIAQANLVGAGDLQGDGLTDVFSPFSAWYGNGGFRGTDGKVSSCPPVYGCGLHVSSNVSAGHEDGVNGAPDFMTSAIDGLGYKVFWDYYPLSSTKAGFYSVVPVGKPERYIDADDYYFTSSMYLVGAYGRSSGVGDGYFAYSYQYGDERYNNAGRGIQGFRYAIEHDLSAKNRQIGIYDQRFPLAGRPLAEWKVAEDAIDDGLAKGVAPALPDYYSLTESWDCDAPKGYSVGGLHCLDSGGPTFGYRLRHKVDHDWDSTLKDWTDVDVTYDYDANARETRRFEKTVSPKKTETVEITTRYAPVDVTHWIVARGLEQNTEKITDAIPPPKGTLSEATMPPSRVKTRTDEDDTYEYDDKGLTHRVVQRGPEAYVETRVMTYQRDPKADDYGRLSSISVARGPKEDSPPDYMRNGRFTYDAGGYFITSIDSVGLDPHTTSYDPATGELLSETKDGITDTYRYDILGRPVHYERTEKDKDPVTWSATYARCNSDDCTMKDAVYFVTETFNARYTITTFYDKRGKRMNHPDGSLLKDE